MWSSSLQFLQHIEYSSVVGLKNGIEVKTVGCTANVFSYNIYPFCRIISSLIGLKLEVMLTVNPLHRSAVFHVRFYKVYFLYFYPSVVLLDC